MSTADQFAGCGRNHMIVVYALLLLATPSWPARDVRHRTLVQENKRTLDRCAPVPHRSKLIQRYSLYSVILFWQSSIDSCMSYRDVVRNNRWPMCSAAGNRRVVKKLATLEKTGYVNHCCHLISGGIKKIHTSRLHSDVPRYSNTSIAPHWWHGQ